MAEAAVPYTEDPWYSDHSFVTSRELAYRMQRDAINEAGKAVIAIPGLLPKRSKGLNIILAPEIPKYNILTYQKMYERIDLAHSIVLRTVEMILSPTMDIRPPESVLQDDKPIGDDLKKNISFVRKWVRYKKFNTWKKDALICAYWAGNSYSEVVPEEALVAGTVGRPTIEASWKIKELKLLPPDEMRPVRSPFGDLLGYVQYPYRGTYTWLDSEQAKMFMDKGGIPFEPWEIIHIKINPEPGEAYGTSIFEAAKDILAIYVGMREDIAMIIKNYAAPMILFRIGTELIPASAGTVSTFRSALAGQMQVSSNIVTSTMVNAEVIGAGQKAMSMEKYFSQMLNVLFGSFGLPEILIGQGNETTEATGKMQLEALSKSAKVIHQLLKDSIELQLFSFLSVGKWEHELTPADLDKIPELWFGPLETEEDKRLRWENMHRFGGATRQEWRKAYGMKPDPEGDLTPEADLKFQKEIIEHTAKMGKKYAPPVAAATKTPGQTPSKPKPTQKKSDRDKEHGKADTASTKKK